MLTSLDLLQCLQMVSCAGEKLLSTNALGHIFASAQRHCIELSLRQSSCHGQQSLWEELKLHRAAMASVIADWKKEGYTGRLEVEQAETANPQK